MDRIAYHPIRVSPHASLFLPYTEQELRVYQNESLNPLRLASSKKTSQPESRDQNRSAGPNENSNSPPGYTTPSPFAITLEASSSCTYPSNDPCQPPTSSSSTLKRAHETSEADDNHTPTPRLIPHPSHSAEPDLTDRSNKRTRYLTSPGHLAHSDPQNSVSQAVAQHYNARPNLSKGARTESPIFGLRKLNNWVKSVIIGKFASIESNLIGPLIRHLNKSQPYYNSHHSHYQPNSYGSKILDLGCGKGGDLAKWQNAGVRELYGFDIARVSIEQAQSRYMQSCRNRFDAKFFALDCFSLPITSVLSPQELREPFHAVSLQFCMHYAFESEFKARTMMENVSKFLTPGGVMIGTIPDPDLLIQNWEQASNESNRDEPSFGNSIYQITFPYRLTSKASQLDQIYGNRYMFYLQDAVEDVPEYLVLWGPFVQMAREYGLKLIYKQSFHEIVRNEKHEPNFKSLLTKMDLIDADGHLVISEEDWEASGIYLAFAFIKE